MRFYIITLFSIFFLNGCISTIPDGTSNNNLNNIFLKNHSKIQKTFKYSKRSVQFDLEEGKKLMASFILVVDEQSYVYLKQGITSEQEFIGSRLSNFNYKKDDNITIELSFYNKFGNEYLVAKISKDYYLKDGRVSTHRVENNFNLGKRGELVNKKINLPILEKIQDDYDKN